MPLGAGYTEYQPDLIFLELSGEHHVMGGEPFAKLQHSPSVA